MDEESVPQRVINRFRTSRQYPTPITPFEHAVLAAMMIDDLKVYSIGLPLALEGIELRVVERIPE